MQLIRPDLDELPSIIHQQFFNSISAFRKIHFKLVEYKKNYKGYWKLLGKGKFPYKIAASFKAFQTLYSACFNLTSVFQGNFSEEEFGDNEATPEVKESVDRLEIEIERDLNRIEELSKSSSQEFIYDSQEKLKSDDLAALRKHCADFEELQGIASDLISNGRTFIKIISHIKSSAKYRMDSGELIPPANDHKTEPFSHSPDFRHIILNNRSFDLSPRQAEVIKVLWEYHDKGTSGLSQSFIMSKVGTPTSKIKDTFRDKEEREALITKGDKKGMFRLNFH